MTDLDKIIAQRKSVRDYKDIPVEVEKIKQILEAARLAPSACNKQPWIFVVANTPKAKEEVMKFGLGEMMVSNEWAASAPVIIVVCSKKEFITHSLAEKLQGVEYHLIDIGIACQNLVLKATELGLGTCYIGWFNAKAIKKVLDLPLSYKVECLIALGYPKENNQNQTSRKSMDEISLWK
ncbi:MAG: nitroreductase family protein [Elusimicrobiota bacterium]|jgi:nitroreductase|nr:nitroreductase family protein [Elusimicrobiota bacterium]